MRLSAGLRTFDQNRWEDSRETVPKRRPDKGSRTRTRIKQRHVHAGLAIEAPGWAGRRGIMTPAPTPLEVAQMEEALVPAPPAARRPQRAFTSADMPDLPANATAEEVSAWGEVYTHAARERNNALVTAYLDPYKSPMGDGPTTRTRRTHDGLRIVD